MTHLPHRPSPPSSARLRGALPRIREVERIVLRVPFRSSVARWNSVLISDWQQVELIRITTDDPDVMGIGETIVEYSWARVTDAAVERVRQGDPMELLADDNLGAGLQMALLDLVGKALGVPANRLLARQRVREWCPIAWWNTDVPPALLAEEAASAVAAGYLSQKFKARPWFDVHDQVASVSAATPEGFLVDVDWNSFLLSPAQAVPVIRSLEQSGRLGIVESPIARTDVMGHREVRQKIATPLAEHFDPVLFPLWMRDDALDGFVVAGVGVTESLRQATLAAAFNKSCWLQMVGTGLTTALAAHLGSVLTHARWPAVTAMNTFAHDLLREPLQIAGGFLRVPEAPGLGVELDEQLVESLRVDDGADPLHPRRRLLTFRLADGRRVHTTSMQQLWAFCENDGTLPVQERGATLELRDDDGGLDFAQLYERAHVHPVWDAR
ncbi:mandelate racemase/muconate lactonizing enzyme family protein [Herbiconiux sp. A18JL235]|uniref:Mandelate racemase/muconate lactonizing enzyme family protein n=1 Tax=Herbiconiux sp. A18JL235 TaxID=3152363 RepID=A0AB39BH88_9MICO